MLLKGKIKRGYSSIELILGCALGVLAVFVLLGQFSSNLDKMIVSGNIKNLAENSQSKTKFSENRVEYSTSIVEIK